MRYKASQTRCKKNVLQLILMLFVVNVLHISAQEGRTTWMADNGNGSFSNPIFYDEFSDPDLIRVGDDYYMTGTTMHTMPGLPILHSRDLVNWELLTYALNRLDLGPEMRLENGRDFYGQGIWAPCFRHAADTFYIFSNVNGHGTQIFTTANPAGPWKRRQMRADLHDLTVLFDDDGKKYAVYGYNRVKMVQLTDDLMDAVPGTEKVIVEAGSGAGEGSHIYKIDEKYYITNTNYDPLCYQVCLRADAPYGPYEVNVMSAEENFGISTGWRMGSWRSGPPFPLIKPQENYVGCIPMHQGGIVQIQSGEWWGWSMLDYNSVGRVVGISPVTWEDGWPYFGKPGNLTRSPRTWIKPNTGFTSEPKTPYERNDDFSGPELKNTWQWNHVPVEEKWSITERKGYLRLHSLPAKSFWNARNSLTQRGVGPESFGITQLDLKGLKDGDIAGLALLNLPYAWLGVMTDGKIQTLQFYNQQEEKRVDVSIKAKTIWLRAHCDFDHDIAHLSYSFDGKEYTKIGGEIILPYQLRTFQGVRFALFNFNTKGLEGGYADFNSFEVQEPRCKGLTRSIPYGKIIQLTSIADSTLLVNWRNHVRPVNANSREAKDSLSYFRVVDRGNGRVALQSVATGGYVSVKGKAGMAEVRIERDDKGHASTFQWIDMLKDDLMLLSLESMRHLYADPFQRSLCSADAPGARPDRKGGACFRWIVVEE